MSVTGPSLVGGPASIPGHPARWVRLRRRRVKYSGIDMTPSPKSPNRWSLSIGDLTQAAVFAALLDAADL